MALFGISNDILMTLSFIMIALSMAIVLVSSFILNSLSKKKTKEEHVAGDVMGLLEGLRQGKDIWKEIESQGEVTPKPNLAISQHEITLKQLLIGKFKPVIEKQLKSKVEIKDFNAKGDNFLALIEVVGAKKSKIKLLLVLDSSGKILDFKRVK
ncbi:MAG: hypothetical protein AABW59_01985 [archaeon]